jgi:hypothetical protein
MAASCAMEGICDRPANRDKYGSSNIPVVIRAAVHVMNSNDGSPPDGSATPFSRPYSPPTQVFSLPKSMPLPSAWTVSSARTESTSSTKCCPTTTPDTTALALPPTKASTP